MLAGNYMVVIRLLHCRARVCANQNKIHIHTYSTYCSTKPEIIFLSLKVFSKF